MTPNDVVALCVALLASVALAGPALRARWATALWRRN